MESSDEFTQLSNSWLYYKLKGINIIFEPSNTNDDARPLYMNLVYGGTSVQNIETDDQTKVVPGYRINFKSYYYHSPSIQVLSYVYQNYHTFQELPVGVLSMFAPESTSSWGGRVEFVIKCKGSKTISGSSKMNYIKDGKISKDASLYKEIKEEIRNIKMEQQIASIQNILLQLCSNINNKVSSASVIEYPPKHTSAVVVEGEQLQVLNNDELQSLDGLTDTRENELGGQLLKVPSCSQLHNRALVDSTFHPCDGDTDVNGPFHVEDETSEMVTDQRCK